MIDEPSILAVLLALWRTPETTLPHLSRATHLLPPTLHAALDALRARRCHIERTPTTLTLISVGLPCWRDLLEHTAAAENRTLARRTLVFQKTASTNDLCLAAATDPAAHGLVALADEQSAGRGRRGSPWLAKPGQSLLLSILLTPCPIPAETLTLQLGLAAALAVESFLHCPVQLKWPNDLYLAGRKLAGVLLESRGPALVLGLGLNVAQSAADFPPDLAATSLYLATGRSFDRLRVLTTLLQHIEDLCLHPQPLAHWLPAWKSRCPLLGQTIQARSGPHSLSGQVLDIDPLHGLVLRDPHGATHFLSAQTTTLSPAPLAILGPH